MGGGELRVSGGSPKLMEADFDYNDPGWKPQVEYHSTGVRSDIEISTAEGQSRTERTTGTCDSMTRC